ncbi:helix-turn-helix domain-containing protein [Arthrobacter sp. B6]|uniref:TetR/AcrR family transcriptional regulator n=1 Tax=Arthrobacter sp. B6 TaxID=1570137 RepID=UPI0009EEA4F9
MSANLTQSETAGSADRRRRGSYAGTDEKRLAILDAALNVFARDGYRGGSLKVVAREAGMSDAGLLHHFGCKSALLAAVLELRDMRAEAVYTPMHVEDPYVILLGLVELARYNVSAPGLVRLHVTLSAEATSPQHPRTSTLSSGTSVTSTGSPGLSPVAPSAEHCAPGPPRSRRPRLPSRPSTDRSCYGFCTATPSTCPAESRRISAASSFSLRRTSEGYPDPGADPRP